MSLDFSSSRLSSISNHPPRSRTDSHTQRSSGQTNTAARSAAKALMYVHPRPYPMSRATAPSDPQSLANYTCDQTQASKRLSIRKLPPVLSFQFKVRGSPPILALTLTSTFSSAIRTVGPRNPPSSPFRTGAVLYPVCDSALFRFCSGFLWFKRSSRIRSSFSAHSASSTNPQTNPQHARSRLPSASQRR